MNGTSETGTWFCSALALIFITLKLTGHIDWSWWWVLSPLWAPVVAVLSLVGAFFAIATCITLIETFLNKK